MKVTPVKLWRRKEKTSSYIGKTGKIVQWTIIYVPSKLFAAQAPYPVVIVSLDSGEKMIGQLVDYHTDDLVPGRKVIAVLRRSHIENHEDILSYNIKFKPL